MKRASLIFALALCCATILSAQESITVMSYNIRYGAAKDGDNSWENRRPAVVISSSITVKRVLSSYAFTRFGPSSSRLGSSAYAFLAPLVTPVTISFKDALPTSLFGSVIFTYSFSALTTSIVGGCSVVADASDMSAAASTPPYQPRM